MVNYTVGVPRAGKSYRCMYRLFSNFAKDKKAVKKRPLKIDGVKKALVNINQIDLSKFDNVEMINWDSFYDILTELHSLYMQKVDDEQLISLATQLGVNEAYIIIDECHNYLDKEDKVLTWWLSYHGHLHQEIDLITQNLSLVKPKYKGFAEFFYQAIPSSRKLLNTSMKYNMYTKSRLAMSDRFGVQKLPIVQEIFNSYVSGKNQKTKSIVHKFLLIAIFAVVFVFLLFKFTFFKDTTIDENIKEENKQESIKNEVPSTNQDNNENNTVSNIQENINEYDEEILDYKFMSLKCSVKYEYCLYNNKKIQLNTYLKLKDIFQIEELSTKRINKDFVQLDILAKPTFYNIFNGGHKNEKQNNITSNSNISIFPTN